METVFTLKGPQRHNGGLLSAWNGASLPGSWVGFTGVTLQLGVEDREVATSGAWPERAGRVGTKSLWQLTKLCLRC